MRKILLTCGIILASSFTHVNIAKAENLVTAAISSTDGTVYQVDLDDRKEYTTSEGWRHVLFWLSTEGDSQEHPAIAACSPYDLKAPYYDFDWEPNGGGLSDDTVGGKIARAACDD